MSESTKLSREVAFSDNLNVATVKATVRKNETDKVRTPVTWKFDFSKASTQLIKELALRSLVIDAQRLYRDDKCKVEDEFDVANMTRGRRAPVPTKDTAAKVLSSMSPEERAAWLQELGYLPKPEGEEQPKPEGEEQPRE